MRKIRWVSLFCVLAACLTLAAAAKEFDGYVVLLDTDVRLLSASEADFPEMSEVYAPAGAYRVDDAAALETLRETGLLISAEPNYIVTLDDAPSLPDAPEEAALLDASETQWYESPLELDWARENGFSGNGVRVGVVDSGLFADHEEFQGVKVLEGANYCVKENDPARKDISDSYGHGTFVSGLIAAAENGAGLVGVAPEVELVPLKCFEGKNGSVANIASAIYDAVDSWHCDILNLSLGLEKESAVLKAAVEYADKAGVVMVAAAGNLLSGSHKSGGDPLNYPAAYAEVIGVGAVNSALSVANFSYRNESVEIVAPGQTLRGPSPTNAAGYVSGYGTSYAAPMVTAAAALALSARPELTKGEVRELIRATARDLGESGYDTSYGYGILHIGRLLAAATGNLLHQAEVIRAEIADADGSAPTLFAAAYGAEGAFLGARDVSPDADGALSDETFRIPGAETWKLFTFDRSEFVPAGLPVKLYGPVADGGITKP